MSKLQRAAVGIALLSLFALGGLVWQMESRIQELERRVAAAIPMSEGPAPDDASDDSDVGRMAGVAEVPSRESDDLASESVGSTQALPLACDWGEAGTFATNASFSCDDVFIEGVTIIELSGGSTDDVTVRSQIAAACIALNSAAPIDAPTELLEALAPACDRAKN